MEDNNFQFGVKLATYEWYQVTSPIVKNTWGHLVGTYHRGNKIEIWLNGELSEETSIPESDLFTSDTHHSSIGAYSQAEHEQEHWDNVIDDVCIYNRAHSESEIQDLHNNSYKVLYQFRDRFLLVNMVGKGFVRLYNTCSPPIANFIANNDSLRAIVRLSLIPVVGVSWVALKLGPVSTMALMLLLGISLVGLVSLRKNKVKN